MTDRFGRTIDYIRISVTDRCNLRCIYCMPEEGVSPVAHTDILSYSEILRLAGIFAELGIKKIKLTGGEPLVRKEIAVLVSELKQIKGIEQVTLTTNGVCLAENMKALLKAGIDGINLSLDTMNPEIFQQITRRESFLKAIDGLKEAIQYPEIPLKINCVPMGIEGQNETELARWAKDYPVHVRFIEMMPIGLGKMYQPKTEKELLKELKEIYGNYRACEEILGNGPAHYYDFDGFKGKVGFISAISHKFCDSCNRVRLTSQGYLKPCLQYDTGVDLRSELRNGSSDSQLKKRIQECISTKPKGHQFENTTVSHAEQNMMSQIGG